MWSVAQAFVQRSQVLLLQREGRREAGSSPCAFFLRFAWFLKFSWEPRAAKSVLGLCGRWPDQVCRPELVQTQVRVGTHPLYCLQIVIATSQQHHSQLYTNAPKWVFQSYSVTLSESPGIPHGAARIEGIGRENRWQSIKLCLVICTSNGSSVCLLLIK